ncbi:hypothetical protein EIN_047430 [Entamoeba invadens IP1]|uniref:Rad51-like C-terminal domain-containing protein n=1 Tax=Entamoeba invadens IP1 TaxID=370355 RepID=A0A0A1UH24_ENTIV|nr:hypothetical protein EIN_047430 [Entamoeba invadens IP1]ELP94450.1 hypothetical protein EIN_047430 [Entamoeba invadens IP1]|eukprot:XP_004261221.1 hypothetical protein EIN_047430 [Entamoeba invadens IP1]
MIAQFKGNLTKQQQDVIDVLAAGVEDPDLLFLTSIDELCGIYSEKYGTMNQEEIVDLIKQYSLYVSQETLQRQSISNLLRVEPTKLKYGISLFDQYFPTLKPEGIIEIAGEAGAGKSQLCIQIMVVSEVMYTMPCYYITDQPFRYYERVKSMSEYYCDLFNSETIDVNRLIQVSEVKSFEELKQRLVLVDSMKTCGLVVIDSFGGILKDAFEDKYTERGVAITWTGMMLNNLINKGHVVIVTNQAVANIKDDTNKDKMIFDFLMGNEETRDLEIQNGLGVVCEGGELNTPSGMQWAYCVRTRLFLFKTNETLEHAYDTFTDECKEQLEGLDESTFKNVSIRKAVVNKSNEVEKGICLEYCILESHVCGLERMED